jgi:5-methylcytosine-specific restriction endonuclease McrA
MKTLPKNAKCPLHGGYYCCGRERPAADPYVRHGVKKHDDGRETCTPAELRRRKNMLLKSDPVCAACGKVFDDYRDVELAHKESKGMNGWKTDDSWENLCLMHRDENREQGSRPLTEYLKWRIEKRLPVPADVYETLKRTQIHAVEA